MLNLVELQQSILLSTSKKNNEAFASAMHKCKTMLSVLRDATLNNTLLAIKAQMDASGFENSETILNELDKRIKEIQHELS